VSAVCLQVEVFATGRLLVQRSTTECGVSEYDRETSIMKKPRPTLGCRTVGGGPLHDS
jgi:hypothetical protein